MFHNETLDTLTEARRAMVRARNQLLSIADSTRMTHALASRQARNAADELREPIEQAQQTIIGLQLEA